MFDKKNCIYFAYTIDPTIGVQTSTPISTSIRAKGPTSQSKETPSDVISTESPTTHSDNQLISMLAEMSTDKSLIEKERDRIFKNIVAWMKRRARRLYEQVSYIILKRIIFLYNLRWNHTI